ncbi:MAG TPA: xanthine dehydrogenase family protein subunit M [Burkholderiales bacterium]|nr:xanthine dehydrogenase family protein subunit M [Burkholderiales bacterium]
MKAPAFAYIRARSLAEVLDLLEKHGDRAKLLAGGQSLIATLNMRLSSPDLLIDISRLRDLSGIQVRGGNVRIGALTTHAEIERSPDITRHLPLLAQAAPHIAHVAIRNVGTFGGSLALADPAAEWPACCIALDARFTVASKRGTRQVKAREFFKGLFSTALRPAEVLTHVDIPIPGSDYRSAFVELARRRGDYAIVGLAALAKSTRGALSDVRLAFFGVGATPVLAKNAMAALEGKSSDAAAAAKALAKDLDPAADLYSSAATKMQLARALTGRAIAALAA